MQKYEKYFKKVYNLDVIYNNQDRIFKHFLGEHPNETIRLHSPFRFDESPGCRFSFFQGKWYFIDNATYNGKLSFDCINLVMALYDFERFQDAIAYIYEKVDLDFSSNYDFIGKDKFIPIIKFKPKDFVPNHYFTQFNLNSDDLINSRCFQVGSYWANTKKDHSLRFNCLGNPNNEQIFAFYFQPTGNVKLYFPERESDKFFTNCSFSDYFGYNQDFDYDLPLIITKSGKDQMLLSKYYKNVVAVQSETIRTIPFSLKVLFSKFKKIIIWFDNDFIGIKYSNDFKDVIQKEYPDKEILVNTHGQHLEKDPSDMFLNNQLIKYLTHDFDRKVGYKSDLF